MNVAKLNPIGYEAKTEKGNAYKKSNLGKSIGTVAMATASIATINSSNPVFKSFSFSTIIETIEQLAKTKIPTKLKPFILGASIAIDVLGGLWMGYEVDKYINKKRAKKADALIAEV